MKTQPRKRIQSLDRALDIVELLIETGDGVKLSEIAAATGLNKTTAFHLIKTLEDRGYVEQSPDTLKYKTGYKMFENASRLYRLDEVKKMIRREQEKYGWEFLFLGANIDAVQAAGNLGIDASRAVNYCCDAAGTRLNYQAVGQAVSDVRASRPLSADWKAPIEQDFQRRGKTGKGLGFFRR